MLVSTPRIRTRLARRLFGSAAVAPLIAALATALIADVGAAAAQTATTQPQNAVEEVVVTARRREERLQDVPVAISAVSAQQLARYSVSDVIQATRFVPQMVVGRQTTGSSVSIFLRGVGSSSLSSGFEQSVSLNIDGVAMSRGREILSSQYDLQQIEVLKGPQALFFGKNSTAGIISITTANPGREFEARVKAGYEFEADERYAEAMISAPLTDRFGARFAIRASEMDGYFDNTARPIVIGGVQRPGAPSNRTPAEKDLGARLTLRYDGGREFDATFKGSYSHYQDSGNMSRTQTLCAAGRTTPQPTFGAVDPFDNCVIDKQVSRSAAPSIYLANVPYYRDGVPYTDYESRLTSLTINYGGLDRLALTSVTGYYDFDYRDLNNFDGATAGVFVTQRITYQALSQEFRARTTFEGPVNGLAGVYFADSKFTFDTSARAANLPMDPATGRFDTFNKPAATKGKTWSAFAELTWNITRSLELAGGARWTKEKKDSFATQVYSSPFVRAFFPLRTITDHFSDENVSPQATLTWRPTSALTVYGAYKEGFKSGGFHTSVVISPATSQRDVRFGSESAKGEEVGVKAELFDRTLRVNATAYAYDYNDLQVNIFDAITFAQRVGNAGTLATKGVELETNWVTPAPGLELHGALAYNKAEFKDYVGPCFTGQRVAEGCKLNLNAAGTAFTSQDFQGRTPPRAPRWAARVGGLWRRDLGYGLVGSISADASYSSSYNFTDGLRPDAVQPAYWRYDAALRLEHAASGWSVALIGRNLSDELVVTSAQDKPTQGSATGTAAGARPDMNVVVDRPRQIVLEVAKTF